MRKGQGMGSFGYSEIYISCDTLQANDKEYLAVNLLSDVNGATCGLGFVREDTIEQKLYFIPQEDINHEEFLIVDYSLEKGDTFVTHAGFQLIVDDVREINFFGKMTKFIKFGSTASDGFVVGFGSLMAGPVFNCAGFTNIDGYEILDVNCSLATGVQDEALERSIQLFPNPVRDQLTILLDGQNIEGPVQLRVRTMVGEVVFKKELSRGNNTFDVKRLPKGMLLLQLSNNKEWVIKKIIRN